MFVKDMYNKHLLLVTSLKQPPALNSRAFKFTSDHMKQKLTCIKQPSALSGQFLVIHI